MPTTWKPVFPKAFDAAIGRIWLAYIEQNDNDNKIDDNDFFIVQISSHSAAIL
jgi:hypothetical protein